MGIVYHRMHHSLSHGDGRSHQVREIRRHSGLGRGGGRLVALGGRRKIFATLMECGPYLGCHHIGLGDHDLWFRRRRAPRVVAASSA